MTLQEAIALIQEKDFQIQELTKQLHSRELSLRTLQDQVEQLLRRVYGRRSEKMHPDQLMFDSLVMEAAVQPPTIEPLAELPPSTVPRKAKVSKHNHLGRLPIPEHLERVEIVLDIPEEEKFCPQTGKPLKQIGCEVSEKLEYRPGRLLLNVYKRPRYASADNTAEVGVLTAPMPDHPIERCKADVGLLSYIIVSKFADHLPLYRQDGIFEREGVDIPEPPRAAGSCRPTKRSGSSRTCSRRRCSKPRSSLRMIPSSRSRSRAAGRSRKPGCGYTCAEDPIRP